MALADTTLSSRLDVNLNEGPQTNRAARALFVVQKRCTPYGTPAAHTVPELGYMTNYTKSIEIEREPVDWPHTPIDGTTSA